MGGVSRGFGWPCFVGGDLVDGDELGSLDLDLGDVGSDYCLLLAWVPWSRTWARSRRSWLMASGPGSFGWLLISAPNAMARPSQSSPRPIAEDHAGRQTQAPPHGRAEGDRIIRSAGRAYRAYRPYRAAPRARDLAIGTGSGSPVTVGTDFAF